MKKIDIIVSIRNFIIFIGAIVTVIAIIFIFTDMAFSATITWADSNQSQITAIERDVKYSYDNLSKIDADGKNIL